jgi:glutamate formiminotransferase/formiminotetrahydrofolate cyclodeaminase
MGAALGAMVGWMTYGKRKFEDKDAVMRRLLPPLHQAMTELLPMIDADTRAFNEYIAAAGLPRASQTEAAARHAAMQEGLKQAIAVPLAAMRAADRCWDAMLEMADHGNLASRSDLEVGARALELGVWGAWRNVLINLDGVEDEGFKRSVRAEAETLAERARQGSAEALARLSRRAQAT